ncbi:MAG: hypothetical protein KDA49_03000 [Rhodospirillaceae bacterium]|nr:hypothetical protein [Rhodospirillaceae bacterium]MCA8931405.1 hypothetical protein [Rhodospirillaceae bacterium]
MGRLRRQAIILRDLALLGFAAQVLVLILHGLPLGGTGQVLICTSQGLAVAERGDGAPLPPPEERLDCLASSLGMFALGVAGIVLATLPMPLRIGPCPPIPAGTRPRWSMGQAAYHRRGPPGLP